VPVASHPGREDGRASSDDSFCHRRAGGAVRNRASTAEDSIADKLEKYSGFNALQASTYIRDAVRYYCPSEAAKTGSPSPSTTEGSCPGGFVPPSVNPDCYFLDMMASDHISGSSDALISEARTACGYMADDAGADPVLDATRNVQRDEPNLSISQAALIAGIAAAAYCPSYIRQSG